MDASFILLIIAAILFTLASTKVTAPLHLGWLGAAFLAVALMV